MDDMMIEALELLREKIYDEMVSLAPSSLEWCIKAEKFISVIRAIDTFEKDKEDLSV